MPATVQRQSRDGTGHRVPRPTTGTPVPGSAAGLRDPRRLLAAVTGRAGRLRTRATGWTLARLAAIGVACAAAWWAVGRYGRPYDFFDMKIYHGAMVWWTSGRDLYEFVAPHTTLGYTYPPFAALVMAPMALVSAVTAGWVNLVLSLLALAMVLGWALGPLTDRYGWPRWFAVGLAVPLAAATEPVRETLGYGQVNLLLLALVYLDMVALQHGWRRTTRRPGDGRDAGGGPDQTGSRWRSLPAVRLGYRLWTSGALAGVGVGLATAVKVTPALFIGYFLVTRKWRAALTALATAAGATLVTFVVSGSATMRYFTSVVMDTSRVGTVDATANQSLAGILARLYDSPTTPTLMWLAFSMLVLAVGLSRAATAHREGDELAAFALVGLTANVICPISWSHHLVFLIPALVVLVDAGLRRRAAAIGLGHRGMFSRGPGGVPALAGLRQLTAALGIYVLYVVSPIWRFEHRLPAVSHYADGLHGALAENSLGLVLIALVALLPWRPGAVPAFSPAHPTVRAVRTVPATRPPVRPS